MKIKRQYVEILQFLSGKNVYDSTLFSCIESHRIKEDGTVVGIKDNKEFDLLRIFPTVKTANKMIEFILKNGALALGGVWQADDDGVINMDNISIVPGAIMQKACGSAGLKPLMPGWQFNIRWEMVVSLQQQIKDFFDK